MSAVPKLLQDAVQTLALQLGFPDACKIEFNRLTLSRVLCSVAYKVVVKSHQRKQMTFFVKCLQNEKNHYFATESRIFFENELLFYSTMLFEFMCLDPCKKNLQATFAGAPKCYKTFSSPTLSYIILEDLIDEGYHFGPVNQALEIQEAYQVLEELGRLHAVSYVMKDQEPEKFATIVRNISDNLFCDEMRPTFGRLFVQAIHDALALATNSLPEGSVYVEKLSLFTLNVYDNMAALARSKEDDEYKVVTHGDIRNTNIMFHEDCSVRFLDYQACRYASPIHDLQYFLLISLDAKTRADHQEKLIQRYHTTVCKVIYRLGSDPLRLFPYSALRDQLAKHTKFALALALVGLPLYMDEEATRNTYDEGQYSDITEPDAEAVLHAAEASRARKTMKCKNKMMEIIIDVVNQGYL